MLGVRSPMVGVLSQGLEQQPIDWHNSVDDWAIDGTHLLVRRRVGGHMVGRSPVRLGFLLSQVLVRKSIDWHNSVDDWAIDGAHELVSRRVGRFSTCCVCAHWCFRRRLDNNQLIGTIPPLSASVSFW